MLYVGIRGVEPPGWAAAEIDVCGIALQDGQAQPQTLGGCNWSQLVRLCSRCREVVPMHDGVLCGDRAEAVRGRRAVVEA